MSVAGPMDAPPVEVDVTVSVEVGADADEACDCCTNCTDLPCSTGCGCDCGATAPDPTAMPDPMMAKGSDPMDLREAAQRRAEAATKVPSAEARRQRPNGECARALPFPAELRAKLVERDGRQFHLVEGYASTFNEPYEMWDAFGPYRENVQGNALDKSLAAQPDVAFLLNHRGMTMARTTNNTLALTTDALGFRAEAWLNPERQDVRDLVSAIDDRLIDEMSFAFMLVDAEWNDAYDEFTIREVNIDRGDVSAVNYGANPYTSIAARTREFFHDVDHLPVGAARAALSALQRRADVSPITAAPAVAEGAGAPVIAPPVADVESRLADAEASQGSVARYRAMLAADK
jgi:HK97 family phage prohead protease